MNNRPWSAEEIADLALPWPSFEAKGHGRSYTAYRVKRDELKRGIGPKPRLPKPTPEWQAPPPVNARALIDTYIALQRIRGSLAPEGAHAIRLDVDHPIAVAFMSDWHIGSSGVDYAALNADIATIQAHPYVYAAIGGDPVDNFILEKLMSASRSQISGDIAEQWAIFRHYVEQVLDSLLWVSSGNHDAWTQKVAGIDGVPTALAGIPVCYTGEGGIVALTVGQTTYRIYRKHRPVRRASNKNLTHFVKEMLRDGAPMEFDIGVSEHLHQADLEHFSYRQLDRVAIACGSYKRVDPHAADLGFHDGGYGVPTVVLYPGERRIVPFLRLADALAHLDGPSLYHAA